MRNLHFYDIAWTPLLHYRANTVHIIKSMTALAHLAPEWTIHLRCTGIPEPVDQLFARFRLACPPNLKVDLIYPPASTEEALLHVHQVLLGSRTPRSLALRREMVDYWRRELEGKEACVYTRNRLVLDLFDEVGRSDVPTFLELHQLKYHKYISSPERPLRLSQVKGLVRAARDDEFRPVRGATRVLSICGPLARQIEGIYPGADCEVIRCCATPPDDEATAGPERDLDLVYAGQLYHWKGVYTLVEAMRHCRPDIRLTVIGGNNVRDRYMLEKVAANYGVADRIDWVGQVDHQKVEEYLRRAKVGLVPLPRHYRISRLYTSPIKVFEMMSLHVPMLAADLPSVRDILTPGVHAEFARANDPQHWAEKIELMLGDEAYRQRLAVNARTLLDSCTYDARAEQMYRCVEAEMTTPDRAAAGGIQAEHG